MNLFSSIENHAHRHPDRPAIVFSEERIDYDRFRRRVNALSAGLQAIGLNKGDRLAQLMPNRPEMIFAFYAAMKLGAIHVALNIMFTKEELDYILDDAEPSVLIAHHSFIPLVQTLDRVQTGQLRVVQVGGGDPCFSDVQLFSALIDAHAGSGPDTLVLSPADEAVIGYTSGTTGFPKGAVHTHENILYHLSGMTDCLRLTAKDTLLAALPFFQLTAFLIHPGMAFYAGATLVVMEKFDPFPFLQLIGRENVTFFAAVPTIYQMLYDAGGDDIHALKNVRFGICAGAPLPLRLRLDFERQIGLRILHCYGSTETPLIAAFERPGEKPEGVSVGKVAPHVCLRLRKSDGDEAKTGEPGEIQLRADRTLKCYWNQPAATGEAIRNGWFATGDIGRLDDHDHLHIIDRSKDMIIRGGFNIYPAEIERVLLQDHRIKEAVVIGVPHDRLGEIPKAFVVAEDGAAITEKEVIDLSREKLARFKALALVEFVTPDFFPRNALGKIQKRQIKQ